MATETKAQRELRLTRLKDWRRCLADAEKRLATYVKLGPKFRPAVAAVRSTIDLSRVQVSRYSRAGYNAGRPDGEEGPPWDAEVKSATAAPPSKPVRGVAKMAKLIDDPKVKDLVDKEVQKAVKAAKKAHVAAVKAGGSDLVAQLKEAGHKDAAKLVAAAHKDLGGQLASL